MDRNKIKYYREKLLEEKYKLENIINKKNNKEKIGSMEDYYSELSIRDNHPADLGTEVYMMELDKGFKNKINDILVEIDESLEKIDNEVFGICDICNKKINSERLDIIPYAKLCIDCIEGEFEEKNKDLRLSGANLIETYNRSRKDILFDDEDSYQAVAKFNEIKKDPSFSTGDNQGIFDEEEEGVVEEIEKVSEEDYKDLLE